MLVQFASSIRLGSLLLCRDIAPEGNDLAETNANLDEMVELAHELQQKTGIQLLWATCNLFAHPRYSSAAFVNINKSITSHSKKQFKCCVPATVVMVSMYVDPYGAPAFPCMSSLLISDTWMVLPQTQMPML